MRVAAYITSYEDQKFLEECITCILRQSYPVEKIFIVDNSKQRVNPSIDSCKVILKHYPENIGISGGLKIGVEWAISEKYDFLWTFDQDSKPAENCLANLIDEYSSLLLQGERVGIVAPLSCDSNTGIEIHGGVFDKYRFTSSSLTYLETYKCDVVITSGSLLSIEASKHSDMPEIDLFIDAVDMDYCLNLNKQGYGIFLTRKATMIHRFSDLKFVNVPFFNYKVTVHNYFPIRRYYICRNHTYIAIKSTKPLFTCFAIGYRLLHLLKSSINILFFESNKFEKILLGSLGTYHGFLGKLGKRTD